MSYGYAEISQCVSEVNCLIDANAGGNEFGTVGGHFDGGLFLRVPVDWRLVEKNQYAHDRPACDPVMVEVGTNEVSDDNCLAEGFGSVMGCLLSSS